MKPASESVSFRVSPELAKRLEREATERGMSRGEYARRLMIDAIEDTEREHLRQELSMLREDVRKLREDIGSPHEDGDKLREEIGKLREDLATVVTALLTRTTPVPVEEAKAWVRSRLFR